MIATALGFVFGLALQPALLVACERWLELIDQAAVYQCPRCGVMTLHLPVCARCGGGK